MSELDAEYTAIPDPEQFAIIPLSGKHGEGKFAVVDVEDYDRLSGYTWNVNMSGYTTYAVRSVYSNGTRSTVALHREVLGFGPGDPHVDHVDGDGLNNRKRNLRPATSVQNGRNRRKYAAGSSKYKGVSVHKRTGRFQVRIVVDGKRTWVGFFDDEVEAAEAYNEAAVEHYGEFACLNEINEIEGRG